MSNNLRSLINREVDYSINRSGWQLPVKLQDDTGQIIEFDAITGLPLQAQVNYPSIIKDADTGLDVIETKTSIVLARRSLVTLPTANNYNKWLAWIPEKPEPDADLELYRVEMPPQGGKGLDFIRLYLTDSKQVTE